MRWGGTIVVAPNGDKLQMPGYGIATANVAIALPVRTTEWPAGRQTATVRGVLVVAGKVHRVPFEIRPGQFFVRRLVRLKMPLQNGNHILGDNLLELV